MKILKDKITSVNNGLRNLHKVPVDRFKIQSLIERLQ
jgi:predicted RNase H-like nuclease (RuvC/YqgF family)